MTWYKQKHRSKNKLSFLAVLAFAVLFVPLEQAFAELEEIVVTSRRFEESITDAPLAVAVFDDAFLRENGVDTVQDILELTPGANWGQFAKAQPNLGLRGLNGIATGNASLEHAVSVVNDGVPLVKAFMMTVPTYDLQRVEVLRGPQGTTFGRNATLGMMHFISARPQEECTGSIEASVGIDDHFGFNGHYGGAMSENLNGRIAFNYTDVPGSVEDETTGDMLEFAKTTALRGSLVYEPSDTFSAYFKLEYIDDEEFPTVRRGQDGGATWLTPNYGSYVNNTDPWAATISPAPAGNPWIVEREMIFATAELSWALDNDISVISITGYQDGDHYSNSDAFGTPFDIRDQLVWNDANVFSQEIRVDNQASGNRVRWLAGVNVIFDEETRLEINESEPMRGNCNFTDPTNCFRNSTLVTDATNETEAFGIFGEITVDISDQLTLAVGGRYSDDSRDMDFETYGFGASGGLGGIGLGNPDPTRDCAQVQLITPGQCGTSEADSVGFAGNVADSWDDFSGKVSLSYAFNDENNFYALYSEGFKAGGFQQDSRAASNLDVILDAEKATNLEFGWKGSYENLIFALTAFKQEQEDVQTGNLVVIGSSQANLLVNAAGVENTGVEFEATWAVTDSFTVGGSIAAYDPQYKSGSSIAGVFDVNTGSFSGGVDVSGTLPSQATDEAYYLWAKYNWQLAGGSNLSIRADLRHRGIMWQRDGAAARSLVNLNGDGFTNQRPELDKTGLRVDWTSADERLALSLWGRNLDDEPDFINIGPAFGYVYLGGSGAVGQTGRRQIGATVRYNFGDY